MQNGFMRATKGNRSVLALDPRTKLFLLILLCIFSLGGAGGAAATQLTPVLTLAPFLFLLASAKWGGAFLYATLYTISHLLEIEVLPVISGVPYISILLFCGAVSHFMPCIMMGYFVISTITVSEFVAALERSHIPQTITIPLSVMFRFFPTVMEEFNAINDAMRMRGIRFGGGHVGRIVEYRLIPLLICSVKIGEELSAASLTRGLGTPVKRTNICEIGFGFWDYLFFILSFIFICCVIWLDVIGG